MHSAIPYLRHFTPIPALLLSAMVISCGGDGQTSSSASDILIAPFSIQVIKNGTLTPGLPIRYEHFDTPRLRELSEQENLGAVVAGASDEFERMLLVKDWVAMQWPHSIPDPYPPWDAIVVLDWIRTGKTGGFCGQYSQVLLQSLAAIGLTGRYVEIGWTDYPYQHFVTEFWSNQYNKWIMMDADFNVHFERSGVPMSALEIHDAYARSDFSEVAAILGNVRTGHPHPSEWPYDTASLYYYLRFHLKADHLSAPDEPPFDRYNDMIEWGDEFTVSWEDSMVAWPGGKEQLTNVRTNDREAALSPLNQVKVTIDNTAGGEAVLRFENNVLHFQHYQVRELGAIGATGEWRNYDADIFRWHPTQRLRVLEVRGMNILGVTGPKSVLSARFAPSGR